MTHKYDSILIGSGQAAPALANALAQRGEKVALIEGHLLGGSCVNAGCTPTKTLRKSARVAHMARRADEFGVSTGKVVVDFGAAMARMRERVDASRSGLEGWLESNEKVDVIRGWGSFSRRDGERFLISVGDREISAGNVYINTGTRPFVPPVDGLESVPHLDNVSLLAMTELPDDLLIVGGSYIGLEMGQIFRRLGAEVTIIEPGDRIAAREDEDVSATIEAFMQHEGVVFKKGSGLARADIDCKSVSLTMQDGTRISGSHILFATGRLANSDRLNLDTVGVEMNERGFISTDSSLRTNVEGIWALGDINGRGAFTHTSYHDHEIVLAAREDGPSAEFQWKNADQRTITYAMFTDPPLGRIGMSLSDARKAVSSGRKILIADRKMADISRAKEEGETEGLIRLIVDGKTEQFLGATILGITGDEVIAVISNYMATGASYRMMQQALPVHPTVAELLPTILGGLKPLGID